MLFAVGHRKRGLFSEFMSQPNQSTGMSELQGAIEQVREKIARYTKTKASINEQNTKAALIQPILRALGWDVEDLDDVHMEYKERSADKPVDYALLLLRSPCAFVEAKALGSSLDDRKWANQIMGYASVAGVEWVVLTDGDEYRIYNSHATVPVEEKLFRSVTVSDASSKPAETLTLLSKSQMKDRQINRMWDVHFVDRQVQSAPHLLFAREGEPDPSLVRLLEKRIEALKASEIKASLRRIDVQISCPLMIETEVVPQQRKRSTKRQLKKQVAQPHETQAANQASLHQLVTAGILSAPIALFKKYKGIELKATVLENGSVEFNGQVYDSCSTAGAHARGTVVGGAPSTNGWRFWKYRDPNGIARVLDFARQAYTQSRAYE